MNTQNIPIIESTYQLLLYLIPVLQKFPRGQKYLLADRIEEKLLDVLADLLEAYQNPPVRKEKLWTSNRNLEKLRFLVRLCYDLGFMDIKRYEYISGQINEIGKMLGGWLKQ
jgi:hypothetical protein